MGTPQDHLPLAFATKDLVDFLQSISAPQPSTIRHLKTSAAFHIIYVLSYSGNTAEKLASWLLDRGIQDSSTSELVLRISGDHIPRIKTGNEVAIVSWIQSNTSIPVPSMVAYDCSKTNALGREYMLMTREPGVCLADIYHSLTTTRTDSILDQLIAIQAQLHSTSKVWSHIGGLCFDSSKTIIPGPVLEETFWFVPEIEASWPAGESFNSLNISGPFDTYVEYITAHVRKYMHAIKIHPSLAFMLDMLPQITQFIDTLDRKAVLLNDVVLRLAHKDLHFGNILVDPNTGSITSILDWEFSGMVPYPRWNPSRAFLWNTQDGAGALAEKAVLYERYVRRAAELGFGNMIQNGEFSSLEQENMQVAANFLRAIVEVCPRAQRQDAVLGWKENFLEAMAALED